MHIIKLDATNSTNDYLKQLMRNQYLDNYTVVVTKCQKKGRGQLDTSWQSEDYKNLTFSILVKDLIVDNNDIFSLNLAVSLSVFEVLNQLTNQKCAIKWPNDIMADQKKIAGILIENNIHHNGEISSVIGIGLNVNQDFFVNLPKVTSLSILENKFFDLDLVLDLILKELKQKIALIKSNRKEEIWNIYHDVLFKKEIPTTFEDLNQQKFMGIIKGVSKYGKLQVLLEDDTINEFALKEIKMLY